MRSVAVRLVENACAAAAAADPAAGEVARFERLKQGVSAAFAFDVWEKFLIGDRDLTMALRAT